MKLIFIIFAGIISFTNIYSQSVNSTIEKIKSNYSPKTFTKDSFKIITEFQLPGNYKTTVDYDSELTVQDFEDYISFDTIFTYKINESYKTYYKKTTFIPETFGDELDIWLNDIPDPLSADLYDLNQYKYLNDIAKVKGTSEFHGKNYLELELNVNKIGFLVSKRDYYNRDFIKNISMFIDNSTYLIAGLSFEVILNPKSPVNMKHDIVFSEYRKMNGVLLPTKIQRYNIDFIKSAVTTELRNAFYDRIDNNIELISKNMGNCDKLNNELQEKCNNYWKQATNDFILMKDMLNKDVFEINYNVIKVQ